MRLIALALLAAAPAVAHADPAQEARSATGACLAAVIDGAPVEDIDGDDVAIRRGKDPVSCTVHVTGGEPVVIQSAVMTAIRRRAELFSPARTKWAPGDYASRETFCNPSLRRALNVQVSTNKPGLQPVLTVTVFELPERDQRCDRDLGLQTVATSDDPAPPAQLAAAPIKELAPSEPKAKKKGWLPRIPGLSRKD